MLKAVLTKSEMDRFDATQIGKIALFRRMIESKLLRHWQRLVSGAEFGDEALGQAMEILAATNQLGKRG